MILFDLLLNCDWDEIKGYDDIKSIIKKIGKPSSIRERQHLQQQILLHIYYKPLEQRDVLETQALILAYCCSYSESINSWTHLEIYKESLVEEVRKVSENIISIDQEAIVKRFDYLDNIKALYEAAEHHFFIRGKRSSRSYFYYAFNANVRTYNQIIPEIENNKNILDIPPKNYQKISSKKIIDEINKVASHFQYYAGLKFGRKLNFSNPVELISNPLRDHEILILDSLPCFIKIRKESKPETFNYEKCVILYHLLSIHWVGKSRKFKNILDISDFDCLLKDANEQNLGEPALQRYIVEEVKKAVCIACNKTY